MRGFDLKIFLRLGEARQKTEDKMCFKQAQYKQGTNLKQNDYYAIEKMNLILK